MATIKQQVRDDATRSFDDARDASFAPPDGPSANQRPWTADGAGREDDASC
jgi:hypothetical protein